MHKTNLVKTALCCLFITFLLLNIFVTPAHSGGLDKLKLEAPTDGIVCMAQLKDVLAKKEFSHVKKKNEIIEAICDVHVKYNVPYELIASVIWTESRFIVGAKNGPNVGLMQVNTRYHKDKHLRSIAGNIEYGTKFLSELIAETGTITGGLSRYNGGNINRVYVRRIDKAYEKFFTV